MRFIVSISSIILAVFLFSHCDRQSDIEAQRLSWITEDPLSIPYRSRLQRFERPNLIRNASFETGQTYAIDSGHTSFVVDGWQQVGQNIEWVDIQQDSIYNRNEVFSGNRSVKIVRNKAYETDEQGEGVISEFIRVIPGNYDFSFYARLKDIMPNRARLGTRLYDAIEVKLMYYDRNKILLNASQYLPQTDQYIDNSNKSLSFANYLSIPSFEWGKVIGKSYPFPFPDGDIPSNAYYLRIYLGLKGTGTMWLDSVSFNYTAKNFSIAERMSLYTDTSYFMHQIIIPTPKDVMNMESVIYFSPDSDNEDLPVIVIPRNATTLALKGANLLREYIIRGIRTTTNTDINPNDILITSNFSTLQLNDAKLVFSLGNTSLYRRYEEIMPFHDIEGRDQGYFIYTSNDLSNLIFLNGNSEIGNYYAVLTAVQLFDRKQPVFHNARIVDYPDFEGRHFVISGLNEVSNTTQAIKVLNELMSFKLNGALLDIHSDIAPSVLNRNLQSFYSLNYSNEMFRIYGMISKEGINPVSLEQKENLLTVNNDEYFQWMQRMADRILSAGLDGVVLSPLWQFPSDSSLCYQYPLTLAEYHESLMNHMMNVKMSVLANHPGRLLQFCPVQFHNELMDLSNSFGDFDLNLTDTPVLWSGSSFFSTKTDDADINRYMDHTKGQHPVFLDNSMLTASVWGQYGGTYPYYAGKLRLFNIFEPYGNTDIVEIYPKLDHSHIYINQNAQSEIDIIRLATAADFTWNIKQYNPDYSLWKVLVMRYGTDVARELILYAGYHAEMLVVLLNVENDEQLVRNLKNGLDLLDELESQVVNIQNHLGNEHQLVRELMEINTVLRNQLDSFS